MGQPSKKIWFFWRRFRAFLGKGWVVKKTHIVTTDNAYCPNPIFLIGTHRSGTSLLRRIVDSHSEIACPPESFFLEHFGRMATDPEVLVGLENLGFFGDEARKGIASSASYFHEAYRTAKGKARWADKTPQYVFSLDNIGNIFGDKAQFVFIFRNPLDVAYSIWKRGWRFGDYSADALENTCLYVADAITRQREFLARNRQACHTIKYEDLVNRPAKVLQELCDFLHEKWDPNMLTFYDHHHDLGTEDPIVRGTRGFVQSSDNWRAWSKEQQTVALSILGPSMLELGYDRITDQLDAANNRSDNELEAQSVD